MRGKYIEWVTPLLCSLATLLLFKFVFFIGYVPSGSMEPAIKSGSIIFGCRITGELRRGDVIIFRHSGACLVKRIAGVPGDVIYAADTRLTLSVDDDPVGADLALTVPDGCYYVLGDNEDCSIDSRYWDDPFVGRVEVIAKTFG